MPAPLTQWSQGWWLLLMPCYLTAVLTVTATPQSAPQTAPLTQGSQGWWLLLLPCYFNCILCPSTKQVTIVYIPKVTLIATARVKSRRAMLRFQHCLYQCKGSRSASRLGHCLPCVRGGGPRQRWWGCRLRRQYKHTNQLRNKYDNPSVTFGASSPYTGEPRVVASAHAVLF